MFSEFADIPARTEAFGANEEVEQLKQMWSCLDIVVSCGLLKECNSGECSSKVFHTANNRSAENQTCKKHLFFHSQRARPGFAPDDLTDINTEPRIIMWTINTVINQAKWFYWKPFSNDLKTRSFNISNEAHLFNLKLQYAETYVKQTETIN